MKPISIYNFNEKYFTNFSNFEDMKNAQLYVINGYIVNSFDMGKNPTVKDILGIWYKFHGNENRLFSCVDIEHIICKVSAYYK